MGKNVLVTGGAGYIGSHLCKALALEGYTPITYDSLETGNLSSILFGPFVQGNVLDLPLLLSTLKTFQPIAVFHLASYTNARAPIEESQNYYRNNLIGTATLLEALKISPCPYLLFSSSASIYGNNSNDSLKIKENSPLEGTSPYARTKLSSEKLIADFCKQNKTYYANLRYFNVAGADLDNEIGELHTPETHLIPLLIQVLQGKKKEFFLFANQHNTHDGTAKRDFIHVADLAQGHIDALHFLEKNKTSITLNLGSETGHTILDIITKLQEKTAKKIQIIKAHQIEEPASLIADTTLAKNLINWNPRNSSLDTILDTALRWHS